MSNRLCKGYTWWVVCLQEISAGNFHHVIKCSCCFMFLPAGCFVASLLHVCMVCVSPPLHDRCFIYYLVAFLSRCRDGLIMHVCCALRAWGTRLVNEHKLQSKQIYMTKNMEHEKCCHLNCEPFFLAMRSGCRKNAFISSDKLKTILYWLLEPLQGLQRVCTW